MAVAVLADAFRCSCVLETGSNSGECLLGRRLPGFEQVRRQKMVVEQEGPRLHPECLEIERWAKLKRRRSAHRVDAADEAPDPLQRLGVVEIGRTAAAARVEREAKAGMHAGMERGDHGDLARREPPG